MTRGSCVFLGAIALTLLCSAGPMSQERKPPLPGGYWPPLEGKLLKTRDEVKALYPKTDVWLETHYDGTDYMFSSYFLWNVGDPPMEIHGWVFPRGSNTWVKFYSVVLRCGPVKLSVDPKTGVFEAKGAGNNEFKDKSVCAIGLAAAKL